MTLYMQQRHKYTQTVTQKLLRKMMSQMRFMPGSIVSLKVHKKEASRASVWQGHVSEDIKIIEALQTKKGPPLMRVLCINRNVAQVRIPVAVINGYPLRDLFFPVEMLREDSPCQEEAHDYPAVPANRRHNYEDYKLHRSNGMNGVQHFVNYGLKRGGWEQIHQRIKDSCKKKDVWVFTDKNFKGPKPKESRVVYVLGFITEDEMHAVGDEFCELCTGFRFLEAVRGHNAHVGMRVCKGPSWGQGVLRLQGWHECPRWKNVKDEGLGTVVAVHAPGELSTECMVKVQWDDVALEEPGLQDTFWYRAGAEDVSGIEYLDLYEEPPTVNLQQPARHALEAILRLKRRKTCKEELSLKVL
jgi:hypothetical protein